MKLGIMQPYFFPYIGYWQAINAVDEYVLYDDFETSYEMFDASTLTFVVPKDELDGNETIAKIYLGDNLAQVCTVSIKEITQ